MHSIAHSDNWGLISLSQDARWLYIYRYFLADAVECVPCTEINENIEPIIPKQKWKKQIDCSEPNEEIQLEFGRPFLNKKS